MKHLAIFAALGLVAGPALAQDYSLGGGLTSLGPTIEGTYDLNDRIDLRSQLIGGFSVSVTETLEVNGSDYDIDGDATFGGLALLSDYYPTASGWRVSGGLFFSNTNLSANFVGAETPEGFEGEVAFKNEVAPMITTGYKHGFARNWYVAGDIGAIISQLEASTDSTDEAVLSEVDSINDELSELPAVPYLSVTVGYQW